LGHPRWKALERCRGTDRFECVPVEQAQPRRAQHFNVSEVPVLLDHDPEQYLPAYVGFGIGRQPSSVDVSLKGRKPG